jgi:DNA-binding NtrC family response regulator
MESIMPADNLLLLLDPHAASRTRLEAMLTRHGYSVGHAGSVAAALELWEAEARPVIILAMRGPLARSAAQIAELRSHHPDVTVVAIGARQAPSMLVAWRAGTDVYVPRPVREADLAEAIEQALQRRATRARRTARLRELETHLALLKTEQSDRAQSQAREALRQLALDLAHEINNPLTPIVGMTEMLIEELPAGHIGHEYARAVIDAAVRIRDVVRSLVAFAQEESRD